MKVWLRILLVSLSISLSAKDLPEGWFKVGSNPKGYDAEVVSDQGRNPPVATLKSNTQAKESGFGTVMQQFFPKDYLGKRVRMTVLIKTENVDAWAGAWLRIDGNSSKTIAFDNMEDRPLKGNTEWQEYSIVLDVSEEAQSMNYGVLLTGNGQVWFDEFVFDVVDESVPLTDVMKNKKVKDKPLNNNF